MKTGGGSEALTASPLSTKERGGTGPVRPIPPRSPRPSSPGDDRRRRRRSGVLAPAQSRSDAAARGARLSPPLNAGVRRRLASEAKTAMPIISGAHAVHARPLSV